MAVLFGVKKYADALWKIVEARNINVNLRTNLIEIKPEKKEAVFQNLDKPEVKTTVEVIFFYKLCIFLLFFNLKYSLLHVTPPMSSPDVLKNCKKLVNEAGFLDVNKDSLQHTKYSNIFGIGDCMSSPNSKTAASVGKPI